ncbi:MAG: aminofutalosine synthase MqnE [Deltaproteobacteria bacterium]|nr:aminofutalosine synthase MqnE [Deltaproteobacteria bacterium]
MTVLEEISEKVKKGLRLSDEEALVLFKCDDVIALGEMANAVREKIHAKKTYYIVNRHVDYSNVCVLSCKFCAFARRPGEAGAFEHSIEEIVEKVRGGLIRGITEVHIVGGFHPTHPWEFYTGLLKAIKKEAPDIHIKAYTAAEIRYFSKKFKMPEEEVLGRLMEAGLGSLPGGGAEILAPEVRKEICGPKGPAEFWLDTHRRAHKLGLKSNATMLYGHIESLADRVLHMRLIRELQDETGGFLSFIPLSFNPKDTCYEDRGYTTGIDDLKTLAIARLYMDNIRHIKAYWVMSGPEVAQLSQYFGADDMHGTVIEENITHMAGALAPEDLPADRLCSLIREAGRVPVQRDSLYREISTSPPL